MSTIIDETALSGVERVKLESLGLRFPLAEEILNDATHLSEEAMQLMKFHGSYQQEDRDQRKERKRAGLEPAYSFMIRSKLPGGVLTADQYLQVWRRNAAGYDSPGVPAIWHSEGQPSGDAPRAERAAGHHLRRLRRRRS